MKTLYEFKKILITAVITTLIIVFVVNCTPETEVDLPIEPNPLQDESADQEKSAFSKREVLSVEELTLSKQELESIKEHLLALKEK